MASIDRRGDGWRVRWRERIGTTPEGEPIWRSRSRQCPTRRAADQVRREVEEASSLGRVWTPQAEQEVIDLRDGYARYLEHMVRAGRSRSTFDGVGSALDVLWEVLGAREGRPLPATLLNREVLGQVWQAVLDRKCAPSTATRRTRQVEIWWAWMFDAELAGVPPPRRLADLPTQEPVEAPAPTWSEADAAIRSCLELEGGWGYASRVAWLSRCTGLRASTCLGLQWDWLDLRRGELHVPPNAPGAKTRSERRGWTAPLAPALVEVLATWSRDRAAVTAWTHAELITARTSSHRRHVRAWERAVSRGEARQAVWAPSGRNRRPSHAWRAGWKAGLARVGIAFEVRQALVGGSRGTDVRYVDGASLPLRQAVAQVPPMQPAQVVELVSRRG